MHYTGYLFCIHLYCAKFITVFTPTDLTKAKLVDKAWKISVLANKSVTMQLELVDESNPYIKIGKRKSCKIEGKL